VCCEDDGEVVMMGRTPLPGDDVNAVVVGVVVIKTAATKDNHKVLVVDFIPTVAPAIVLIVFLIRCR
jgi:hypothetical protein